MENSFRREVITYCQRLFSFFFFRWLILLARNSYNVLKLFKEKYANSFNNENECILDDIEEEKYNKLMSNNNHVPDIPEDIYGVML